MLLSLIAILVLLVVAFYSVWVVVTGHVSGPESPELHLPGRALMAMIALVALGAAYAVYRLPDSQTDWISAAAPATLSPPPETRSSTAAASEAATAQSVKDDAVAVTTVGTAASTASGPGKDEARNEAEQEDISGSAALHETEVRQPLSERGVAAAIAPAMPTAPRYTAATAKSPPAAAVPQQVAIAAAPPKGVSRRLSSRHAPLTLHIQNTLGRDQQYEQLTLSIEGLAVAEIAVDEQRTVVAVAVPLPRPGLLHYRLEGVSDEGGSRPLLGEGCIRVRDGSRFAVRRRPGSQKVFLETAAGPARAG